MFSKLDVRDKEDVIMVMNRSLGGTYNSMTIKEIERKIVAVIGVIF